MKSHRAIWIVIGAGECAGRPGPRDIVLCFDTIDDLDRWRANEIAANATVAADVSAALGELGVDPRGLPHPLARVLERLGQMHESPRVAGLIAPGMSRRTFYRVWRASFPEPPARFLDRVRCLHALRLVEQQRLPKKSAALAAGYGSPASFKRARTRRAVSTPAPRGTK